MSVVEHVLTRSVGHFVPRMRVIQDKVNERAEARLSVAFLERHLHRLHHSLLDVGERPPPNLTALAGQMRQQRHRRCFGQHQCADKRRVSGGKEQRRERAVRMTDHVDLAEVEFRDEFCEIVCVHHCGIPRWALFVFGGLYRRL